MKNKGLILTITVLVSLLCLFYLSFTLVSRKVDGDAIAFATDKSGKVDFERKQFYLDSMWTKTVYDLGFVAYTLKEVKEQEIALGLDLQGGMNLTLEVSPIEILKSLSANSNDPDFLAALKEAQTQQKSSQEGFVELFFKTIEAKNPDKLREVFVNASNKGRLEFKSTNEEIKTYIREEIDGAVDRAFDIIRTRIDKFGVTSPNIQLIPGTGRIQIELPGASNPQRVRKLVQGVAKLEFYNVWEAKDYVPILEKVNKVLIAKRDKTKDGAINSADTTKKGDDLYAEGDSTKKAAEDDLFAGSDSSKKDATAKDTSSKAKADSAQAAVDAQYSELYTLNRNPYGLAYATKDTSKINRLLADKDAQITMPSDLQFLWGVKPIENEQPNAEPVVELYAIRKGRTAKALLGGDVISDARSEFDEKGRAVVSMRMNTDGARVWQKATGENVGKQIAIVLDDYVYSAPVVQGEIAGGNSQISGNFTIEEAKDLANILKAGKLPAPTRIVEDAVIGPSLGVEAQSQGLNSTLIGLALVLVFVIAYYAKGGFVADIALLVNVFFTFGIMAQFNSVLTLPGIAGIALSIGMAIDANVLIFERMREELEKGRKLLEAIEDGYDRAFITIFDSNITTMITAVFLYVFGSGPIKGFAITLMIGLACSFFTSVWVTKLILHWMTAKKGNDTEISLTTGISRNLFRAPSFDFIAKKKVAYIFSSVIIIAGIGAMAFKGLNLGVDFKGGRSYVIEFASPIVASDVKVDLANALQSSVEAKTYQTSNKLKITTSYLVDDESEDADKKVETAIMTGLKKYESQKPTILSTMKVGSTIADDIVNASRVAVLLSLLFMFIYIIFRFKRWQFGLGAIVSLAHNALIVLAIFAILYVCGVGFEIDQIFVAAMLTIIGYSINDTIVVFDRVREMIEADPKRELKVTINLALNATLSRTIMTASTTIIVILVMLIFGGEVLRGFSFALLIGIIFGTYSSIYIATPLVLDTSRKEFEKIQAASADKPEEPV